MQGTQVRFRVCEDSRDVHGITAVMLEVHFMEFVLNLWCNKHPIPFSLAQQLFTPEEAFSCTEFTEFTFTECIAKTMGFNLMTR